MKQIEKKVQLITIVLIIIVLIPYIYTIFYALPSTDDFWMAAGVDKNNVFWDAVEKANSFWMNWGGMWLYEFFRVFLNPLVWFEATTEVLGIELGIFFGMFVASIGILNHVFWKYVIGEIKNVYSLLSFLLLLVWFLNTEVWTEVFYWFVGSAYMWAMSLSLLTVALELIFFRKPNFFKGTLLSVTGAIACSFYSQAVFPGAVFLLLIGKEIYEKRKVDWKKIIPFLFFLAGAFSSLIAPGNFQRKGETGISLLGAVKDTTVICIGNLFDLFKNPLTLAMAFLFVLLGIRCMKKGSYRYPLLPFLMTLVLLFIAYFPFALGYGTDNYVPNRAKFSFYMFAVLAFSCSFLYLGGWIKYEKGVTLTAAKWKGALVCLGLFAYISLIPTQYYEELPYMQAIAQSNQVKLANDEWRFLLNRIENAEEEDVVFERSVISTPIIKSPGITGDKENSINRNMADYYGKKSVCVYWW